MPKTATAHTEAAEPAGLVALRERIAKMEADAAAALAEEQRLAADAEQLKEAARKRHAQREKLEREIQQAEREALDIERSQPAPPIDRATAVEVAEALLAAFDSTNDADGSTTEEQRAASLWRVIDDVRCRLLTTEVAEDARPIVLAANSVISSADDWEGARRPEAAGAKGADGEPLADLRWQSMPSGSNQVRAMVAELRMVVAGESPEHATEGVGELISQNVTFNQICKMHGLQLPDGSADLQTLGFLIDRALGATGFYSESNQWRHLKASGALNRADAWKILSASLETRRKASHSLPGAAQRAGALLVGRMIDPPEGEPVDHRALHESNHKFGHYHRQRLAAEAAASTADIPPGQPLSGDQVRSGLHAQMSRRQ